MPFNLDFFKDKKSAYTFALLHMDGKQRADALGITEELYLDKHLAKQWYTSILANLGDSPDNKAVLKLNYLHKVMTDEWDEDNSKESKPSKITDVLRAEEQSFSIIIPVSLFEEKFNSNLKDVELNKKLDNLVVEFTAKLDELEAESWLINRKKTFKKLFEEKRFSAITHTPTALETAMWDSNEKYPELAKFIGALLDFVHDWRSNVGIDYIGIFEFTDIDFEPAVEEQEGLIILEYAIMIIPTASFYPELT